MSIEVENFAIRPLTTFNEFDVLVDMQQRFAGIESWEVYPKKLFKVATQYGGAALCLFDSDNRPRGFAYHIPGRLNGELIGWSYLMIIDRNLRNSRWEQHLRSAQRESALASGITKLCWTIDPLDGSSAERNFSDFGVTGVRYLVDFPDKSGRLFGGLPMPDRLVLEWELTREAALIETDGPASTPGKDALTIDTGQDSFPLEPSLSLNAAELFVPVPTDMTSRSGREPDYYIAWRQATRSAFIHYLDRGYRVVSYLADIAHQKRCGAYQLERVER